MKRCNKFTQNLNVTFCFLTRIHYSLHWTWNISHHHDMYRIVVYLFRSTTMLQNPSHSNNIELQLFSISLAKFISYWIFIHHSTCNGINSFIRWEIGVRYSYWMDFVTLSDIKLVIFSENFILLLKYLLILMIIAVSYQIGEQNSRRD